MAAFTVSVESAVDDGMVTVHVAGTVADATSGGLFHPSCRHSLSAYLPGATKVPTHTADPQGDAARQRLRELERRVRKQRLLADAAIDPVAGKEYAAKARALQGQIRDHVAASKDLGIKRKPEREQPNLGFSAAVPATKPAPTPKPSLTPAKPAVAHTDGLDTMELQSLRSLGSEFEVSKAATMPKAQLLAALRAQGAMSPEASRTQPGLDGPGHGGRHAGTDILDNVLRDSRDIFMGPDSERGRYRHGVPYDAVLGRLAEKQGYNGLPRVGSPAEVDRAVAAGWIETWRGGTASQINSTTVAEVNSKLRFGAFEPGRGIYGNGVYTSERYRTAEQYAGIWQKGDVAEPDGIMRIAIDPSARIVGYDEIVADYKAWSKTKPKLTDNQTRFPASPEYNDDPNMTMGLLMMRDLGRYAASRGYDAIKVTGKDDGGTYRPGEHRAPQYAVLNRTVLLIQDAERQAGK